MNRWWVYLKERSPVPLFLVVGAGPAWSATFPWDWKNFILSLLGMVLFLFLARLMDELKDYHKDQVAHPNRPLPRGLFQAREFRVGVNVVWATMLMYSMLLMGLANGYAAVCYAGATFYLWLMYKEFYFGQKLADSPFLYAATHQLILFPLVLFVLAVQQREGAFSPLGWAYGIAALGASMSYEICRKLDVHAHPVLKTYRAVYGMKTTAGVVLACNFLAAVGAWRLGVGIPLGVLEILAIIGMGMAWVRPRTYKIAEIFSAVSFLGHLYALVIARAWGAWG